MAESLVLAAGATPMAGYKLVRLLGRGGFGEVWEARAPGDFHVALKFLRLGMREADMEQRALEVIRHVRHVHLLDVQFATRVADCLVIAMPLCDQTLLDRLHACQAKGRPGIPRNELLRYMTELAMAIDYLNQPRRKAADGRLVGVQHRDIKPHNVFLVSGSVRLADFGLAKILAASAASTQGSMSPHYAAPEVIQGKFSKWSDQYSLAATYFELRTGNPLFQGENVLQVIYAHVNRLPELNVVPEQERRALARALAKRPEERWPTCRDFVRALLDGIRGGDHRASAKAPTNVPASAPTITETKPLETQLPPPITQGPTIVRGADDKVLRIGIDRGSVAFWILPAADGSKASPKGGWYVMIPPRDLLGGIADGRYEGTTDRGLPRFMIVTNDGGRATVRACTPSGSGKSVNVDSKELADAVNRSLDRILGPEMRRQRQ
jgi:serine/threonine-protein kinase